MVSSKFALFAAIVAAAALLQACGGGGSGSALIVSPSTASVPFVWPQQFTAKTSGGATVNDAQWSVNGIAGGSAEVGTIDSSGRYVAPAAAPSPSTVTVTAVQGKASGTASLQITGLFAYATNQLGGNISGYSIASSGVLYPLASSPTSAGTRPYWITADPAGKFLYVPDETTGSIYGYTINAQTGALTSIGAPTPLPIGPIGITVHPSGIGSTQPSRTDRNPASTHSLLQPAPGC